MESKFKKLKRKIELIHQDYESAVKFAMKLWYAGKPKGDWRSTGTKRDIGKYITDHSLGKLAELGFAEFLKVNWGIEAVLDFKIHPGTFNVDKGDLVKIKCGGRKIKPRISIDIKSTKKGSLWAMVDLHEFNNREYNAYAWVKVDLPLNHLARPIFEAVRSRNMKEIEALIPSLKIIGTEVIGFAYREDVESWREINKGSNVFDPNNPRKKLFTAKTDNKANPAVELRNSKKEWEKLIRKLWGEQDL